MSWRVRLLSLAFALLAGCSSEKPPLAFGLALHGEVTDQALALASAQAGIPPAIVALYTQWPAEPRFEGFPATSLAAIEKAGAVACVTWEPMSMDQGEECAIPANRILSGEFDPYIDAFARAMRDHGRPLMLRFGHEMNLARYHWGTAAGVYGPDSPDLFRRMFRHVRQRFRDQGAANVLFVFCPNAEALPAASWNTLAAWYPGADAVDILGLDGYDWGRTRTRAEHGWDSAPRSFKSVFKDARAELRRLNPETPLIVFETATADPGGKAVWLQEAVEQARDWGLAGLVWFQADKEVDWRLPQGGVPQAARGRLADPGRWLAWVRSLTAGRQGG
ncbi:MAG TPA: endoglucanase [Desulfovibrio sp.]|nr:endoglucanase [Desulfovibrio sp.]